MENNHPVTTDGGTLYRPQACKFLKIKHHLHRSEFEKSIFNRENDTIMDQG